MGAAEGIGLGLEIAGGVVTIFGFNETMTDLVPGSDGLPGVGHLRKSGRWLKRKVTRSKTHVVVAAGSASMGGMMSSAYVIVTAGPDAPVEHRIELLERYVLSLGDRIGVEAQKTGKAVAQVADRLTELQAQIERVDQSNKERIIGGPNGHGLVVASLGVLLTIVGAVVGAS